MAEQKIDIETLVRRYTAGERDFSNLVVKPTYSGEVNEFTSMEDFQAFQRELEACPHALNGVDLSDINLSKSGIAACFDGAILRRANLRDTVWCKSPNEDIDFTGADMTGFSLERIGGVFVRCNFTDVMWDESTSFWNTTFYGCINENFEGAQLGEARFLSIGHWRG